MKVCNIIVKSLRYWIYFVWHPPPGLCPTFCDVTVTNYLNPFRSSKWFRKILKITYSLFFPSSEISFRRRRPRMLIMYNYSFHVPLVGWTLSSARGFDPCTARRFDPYTARGFDSLSESSIWFHTLLVDFKFTYWFYISQVDFTADRFDSVYIASFYLYLPARKALGLRKEEVSRKILFFSKFEKYFSFYWVYGTVCEILRLSTGTVTREFLHLYLPRKALELGKIQIFFTLNSHMRLWR